MRPLFLLLVFGLLGIVFIFGAGPVGAEEGDIQVLDQSAESRFPDGIEFTVTVQSTSEIDEIRVYYKTLGLFNQSAYQPVEFQPGKQVTGSSLLKSHGSTSVFPPGTRVEYSFEIIDKAGSVLRTPDREFIYTDNRFEWHTITSGLVTVYYYGEDREAQAKVVLDSAMAAWDLMVPILGIAPTKPLRIVVYNNYRHMSAALLSRSQTTAEHLITQGTAYTNLRVLLVLGSDASVRGVTFHEFVHLLVAEAAGRAISHVPSWLNEGLAEARNIDPSGSYDSALRQAIAAGQVKPLWYQSKFSGSPNDIIVAYGQGKWVVSYMIDNYGTEKMGELFKTLKKTRDIDLALEQVYGWDQYGLDSEWRMSQGMEPLPPPERLVVELRQFPTPSAPAQDSGPAGEPTLTSLPDIALDPPVDSLAEATPNPALTSLPEVTANPTVSPGGGNGQAGVGGCNAAPAGYASGLSTDLGALLLLASPLGLVWAGRRRRRH